ncbi:MAG: hypothetical protein ACYTHM_22735 [Planctomycetota bacterium]
MTENGEFRTFDLEGGAIRIDGQGAWFAGPLQIVHPAVLDQDTPFFITGVRPEGEGRYTVTIYDGTREELDPSTLHRDARGFKARIKGGLFPARLTRTGYIDLAHLLVEGPKGRLTLPLERGGTLEVA